MTLKNSLNVNDFVSKQMKLIRKIILKSIQLSGVMMIRHRILKLDDFMYKCKIKGFFMLKFESYIFLLFVLFSCKYIHWVSLTDYVILRLHLNKGIYKDFDHHTLPELEITGRAATVSDAKITQD